MRKKLSKLILFSILFIYVINLSLTTVASAAAPYYKIPKKKDFNPSRAADRIEMIVNSKSVINCSAADNKIIIDGEAVAQKNNEAVSEIEGYISKLSDRGMYLNRELVNTVTVKARNIDFSEFADIVIDSDNISKITDVNFLKIILDNNNEYIGLTKDSITYIADKYKTFTLQIKRLSDTYTIRFLDTDNNIINKYDVDIKAALPATHREQTVYLFKDNVQENWGGQYNAVDSSIEFMTKYSGEYTVSSPEIAINDIEDLSDYEKQAIRFMVVRGYFNLKNSSFNPSGTLTRYDFAESLVRMFFALDDEATCSFSDVDRAHYRYVAASEQDNIVDGFDDGTFRGRDNVTVEQVLALTSRTINNKNGYVYPENVEKYLNFTPDNVIGDWAKKEIAMSIREGIYSPEMNLKFSENITRKDAAVILYRLFMIMNNTPEPSDVIEYTASGQSGHKTIWTAASAIITGTAVVIIDGAALTFAIIFIKRKRRGR